MCLRHRPITLASTTANNTTIATTNSLWCSEVCALWMPITLAATTSNNSTTSNDTNENYPNFIDAMKLRIFAKCRVVAKQVAL